MTIKMHNENSLFFDVVTFFDQRHSLGPLLLTAVIVDLLLSGTNFIDISASFLGGNAMPNSLYFLHNCWLMHF